VNEKFYTGSIETAAPLDAGWVRMASSTVEFLRQETRCFISPELWLPDCLDLTPWISLQEHVYKKPVTQILYNVLI